MNKIIAISFFSLLLTKNSSSQQDTSLSNRVNEVMKFTQVMDFEKVLDYTYPKLFSIVPREELKEVLISSFETEEFITSLDSLNVLTIFPVFAIGDESFAKLKYSMLMRMKFKEASDTTDKTDMNMMVGIMEMQFGKGYVRYDHLNNTIVIFITTTLIAIKNKTDDKWNFVNFDEENQAMIDMLFSKEVQDKLKEYK